ncbi:MAG: imidazolonepropionase [Patiriisocius sp.]|jgi:imidazolonepropionase
MKKLIHNIKHLVQVRQSTIGIIGGKEMKKLPILENAWLSISNGLIEEYGNMPYDETRFVDYEKVNANGGSLYPSWVDSHTHIVYAGNREGEFVDRINGMSYEQIAANGGGILNSAKKLSVSSEDELYDQAWHRLNQVMNTGTGAVEIKSGYGLTLEAEMKMLRVIKRLKKDHPLTIKSTFLGAHALPKEYKNRKTDYIKHVIDDMLPLIAEENLADYIDVFCEKGYFEVDDTNAILAAGAKFGLRGKTHVNQFYSIGGIQASIENNALSVDHLEVLEDSDLEALVNSNTIPVALPGCSLFLSIPYTPARKIIDAGLPLVLASDFNPGSCPSGNMSLVVSLGCIKMNMTPEEAINAATINGAFALELENELGSITPGKKANFFITKNIPSASYLPYSFGENLIEKIFIAGKMM